MFILVCSFQKSEPWQPSFKPAMPHVSPPEACEDEDVLFRRLAAETSNPRVKAYYQEKAEVSSAFFCYFMTNNIMFSESIQEPHRCQEG